MQVVEKFISINGEGTHAGELAAFIRFKGCNISCSFCDTDWANAPDGPYEEMSPYDIAEYVSDTGVKNVTLTGGEPLLQTDMPELVRTLFTFADERRPVKSSRTSDGCKRPLRVEIETNGSVDISPFCNEYRPVFTLDYKLPSSGCEGRMLTENFRYLTNEDTVKFVCGSTEDMDRARQVTEKYGLSGKCYIYLSPVFGKIEPADMVDYMVKHKMNGVRLQLQMHKVIWDPEARGV